MNPARLITLAHERPTNVSLVQTLAGPEPRVQEGVRHPQLPQHPCAPVVKWYHQSLPSFCPGFKSRPAHFFRPPNGDHNPYPRPSGSLAVPLDLTLRGALLVAAGALVGGLARWLAGGILTRDFPYGTMAVNVLGSYVLALFMFAGVSRGHFGPDARLFFGIGCMGAFTTMSSFTYDTLAFLEAGDVRRAMVNILVNPLLSLLAAYGGLVTARAIP